MLGLRGSASRASTWRDEPGDIDIPDPMYEGTRTREHGETVPSAGYHLFLQADDIAVLPGPRTPSGRATTQVNEAGVTEQRECLLQLYRIFGKGRAVCTLKLTDNQYGILHYQ